MDIGFFLINAILRLSRKYSEEFFFVSGSFSSAVLNLGQYGTICINLKNTK